MGSRDTWRVYPTTLHCMVGEKVVVVDDIDKAPKTDVVASGNNFVCNDDLDP